MSRLESAIDGYTVTVRQTGLCIHMDVSASLAGLRLTTHKDLS